jgi:hypothetical protein
MGESFQLIAKGKGAGAVAFFCFLALFSALPCNASVIIVTAIVNNVAPAVSDQNISPSTWTGSGSVTLGFQCTDPNGIADLNKANATITGANAADLNNIAYTVSGAVAIISTNISGYLTTKGTYYVTPFCIDDSNSSGAGTKITAYYLDVAAITISSPANDTNTSSNSVTVSFDVNKNTTDDINSASIRVDLNGTASAVFDYSSHCTQFSGHFHCSYTETGLSADADTNLSIDANNVVGQSASQQSVLIHYDATAPAIASVSATGSGSDVAVTWSGSDSFTGIESYYVREDSGSWIEKALSTTHTFSGSASADHTYYVKARDYADNNSLISSAIYTAPTTPVTPTTGPGGGGGGGGGGGPSVPPVIPPAAEGIFDLNLIRIDDPVEAGEKVDFTFVVKNSTKATNGNAYITYWIEQDGKKVVSGSETIYLLAGESREISEALLSSEEMSGRFDFYLSLSRAGQKKITLKKTISIMVGAPTKIELKTSSLLPGEEDQPVTFALDISSNRDATLPVTVEEKIFKDDRIVWQKKQTVLITVSRRFFEEVYGLEPGNYRLEVVAVHGDIVKTDSVVFEKKLRAELIPILGWLVPQIEALLPFFEIIPILIALLLLVELLLLYRLWLEPKFRGGRKKARMGKIARITLIAIALIIVFLLFLYLQKDAIIASKLGQASDEQQLQLLEDISTRRAATGASILALPSTPAYLIALIAIAGAAWALFLTFRERRKA